MAYLLRIMRIKRQRTTISNNLKRTNMKFLMINLMADLIPPQ